MRPNPLFLFFILLFCASCSSRNEIETVSSIVKQLDENPKGVIDLTSLGPATWDKICVVSPYMGNSEAAKRIGFEWDVEKKTSIYYSDHISLLVFIKGEEVIAFSEHPRDKGDFTQLQPPCLPRTEAKVIPTSSAPGGFVVFRKQT